MKLTYAQLEFHLTKKLFPAYLVSGDDVFLKQETEQWIRKAAENAGFIEHIRLPADSGWNENALYQALYSPSLMAEKRLLELDFSHALPNKILATILQDYAQKPLTDNFLLIKLPKIDIKISKSSWYQALEKISATVTLWPIPREQLPAWIIKRAKKYRRELTLEAAQLLTEYVEGNLIAAANMLEKIYLLTLQKTAAETTQSKIDGEFIKTILTDESRFTVFDFIETWVAGDSSRALHILNHLEQDGVEPAIILWSITRELRLLNELALERQQGASYENLFQKHRIFARRQSAVRHFLTRFQAKDCHHYLREASEIDKTIKGIGHRQIWEQLQLFCLRLI